MATPQQYKDSGVVSWAVAQLPSQEYHFNLMNSGTDLNLWLVLEGTWSSPGPGRVSWAGTAPEIVNTKGIAISVNAVSIATGSTSTPSQENMFFIEHATQSLDPNDRIIYDPIHVDFNT